MTIGVLSDSFDTGAGSYATDISTGDLPEGIQVLADFSGGTDEGRGMMQLIHDVVPGAELAFHTAFNGQADFANGIVELATLAGADVIVDDVIYFAEPMFQDGIIAQAVDTVESMGVSYFSAAGNSAQKSYESAFVDSGVTLTVGNENRGVLHDFDPGPGVDFLQKISVPYLSGIILTFQWDESFFSVGGGIGSTSDLDIYVVNLAGTTVFAESITRNIGGDPVEVLQFTNPFFPNPFDPSTFQFNIMITNFEGPDAGLMKYVRFDTGPSVSVLEYDTLSSTTFGHANAAGAGAVGAAYYGNTPAFGQDPPLLEPFSSAGVTPILFDTAGNRLATPEIRTKPGIVAPDGTDTTFFGSDTDGNGFPNFFGTSAAAPHAAAVAALMFEANPGLTPADIFTAMENTALDMETPGFDNLSGFGFLQADLAIAYNPEAPRLKLIIDNDAAVESAGTTTATVTRRGVGDVTGQPELIVNLASSDESEATLPATVTIPAGLASVSFEIAIQHDPFSDGTQTVIVTAADQSGVLLDGTDELRVVDDEAQFLSQWANTVIDFSSQWTLDPFGGWLAVQTLDDPNTFEYGDLPTAWAAETKDGTGVEWLILGYGTPVLATGATFRETWNNGFMTMVEVRNAVTGDFQTVWNGVDPSLPGSPVDFEVDWTRTEFFVDALRVTIDSNHVRNDREEIGE